MDKIKVLVVDDHPMVLEGMRSMLAQISFVEISGTVSNAFDAIEMIKINLPDIVITDINMPEVSGIDLTVKIRKEFPAVRVVAMSTLYFADDTKRGIRLPGKKRLKRGN